MKEIPQDDLRALAVELSILMGIMGKTMRMGMEQRIQAQGVDISGLQYGVCRFLEYEGEHTITDLAKKFALDPSTFVPVIDALERKGFVTRQRDLQDRRRVLLSLTPTGDQLVKQLDVMGEGDPMYESLKRLGTDKGRQLVMLLREMVQHMPDGEHILDVISMRLNLLKR